eukprot:gene2725-14367_t
MDIRKIIRNTHIFAHHPDHGGPATIDACGGAGGGSAAAGRRRPGGGGGGGGEVVPRQYVSVVLVVPVDFRPLPSAGPPTAERLRDPATPDCKGKFTQKQFLDFYGAAHGQRLWLNARKRAGSGGRPAPADRGPRPAAAEDRRPPPARSSEERRPWPAPDGDGALHPYADFEKKYWPAEARAKWRRAGRELKKKAKRDGRPPAPDGPASKAGKGGDGAGRGKGRKQRAPPRPPSQLESAAKREADCERKRRSKQSRFDGLSAKLDKARAELEEAESDLEEAKTAAIAGRAVAEARRHRKELEAERASSQQRVDKLSAEAQTRIATAESEATAAKRQQQEVARQLAEATAVISSLREQ